MTPKEWIDNQKEIESKSTPGTWISEAGTNLLSWTIGTDKEIRTSGRLFGPTKHRIANHIVKDDTDFIAESRNNYLPLLEALEIALITIDRDCFCKNPYDESPRTLGCVSCRTIFEVKKKLGVTE